MVDDQVILDLAVSARDLIRILPGHPSASQVEDIVDTVCSLYERHSDVKVDQQLVLRRLDESMGLEFWDWE